MKTFFILGRNPELSRAEVLEYLKARNREHKEITFSDNILIIETAESERFNVQEFGGVISLGKILFEGNFMDLKNYFDKNEIVPADKFSYSLHGNLEVDLLKEKFKRERKKAVQKHGKRFLELQDGTRNSNAKADFHILFHEYKSVVYLGVVEQLYDSSDDARRDMEKPDRRESLSISPRLSKILINLSGAKAYGKLLDPFCGIGGILQEALVKKINVYGIDKDKQAIAGAKKNLEWLGKEYKLEVKYQLENKDSRHAPDLQFSAIATESPLGELMTKKPSGEKAKQAIQNFEAYIIPILKQLKKVKKPSAKIAITFPVIRNFRVDFRKVAMKSGLRVYLEPILEFRKDQFVSRDFLVLE